MMSLVLWLLLAVIAWPLALLVLVLYPLIWLLSIPFRLLGLSVRAVFELLETILRLPSRVLRGPQAA